MPQQIIAKINEVFNNKKVRKMLLKLRLPLGVLAMVFIATQVRREWFFPGLIVSVLGELFQVWCFSTIKTKKKLTVTGPYMFMRNPMYIGRFFLIFGIILMTGNLIFMIGCCLLYYFYMTNRVKREEKLLEELFGEDYRAYCRDVHPYLPSFKRFDPNHVMSFNKESFRQNHAAINMAATGAVYIILFIVTFTR